MPKGKPYLSGAVSLVVPVKPSLASNSRPQRVANAPSGRPRPVMASVVPTSSRRVVRARHPPKSVRPTKAARAAWANRKRY